MADVVKAVESELFGAHEWAGEHDGPLAAAPEPEERLEAKRALVRAAIALGEVEEAERLTIEAVEAESEVAAAALARLDALDAAREPLLAEEETAAQLALAPAYVARVREAWQGPRAGLAPHAALAAVLLGLLHRRAESAALFEELAAELSARVAGGALVWRESAQAAWYRAMVAWRGEAREDAASRAEERARAFGGPSGSMR